MPSREEFLRLIWAEIINSSMKVGSLENVVAYAKKNPQAPFADSGAAIERILAKGADPRDLSLAFRGAVYDAVISLLYMLGDPGIDGDAAP
jgi:hypothetical protein